MKKRQLFSLFAAVAIVAVLFLTSCSSRSEEAKTLRGIEKVSTFEYTLGALSSSNRDHVTLDPVIERPSYEELMADTLRYVTEMGRISIRASADSSSEIIGITVRGESFITLGTEGNYTKVLLSTEDGSCGYVATQFLSEEEPDSSELFLNVPLFMQTDGRWGAIRIGDYETLATAGCTTTCLSMLETYLYGEEILPDAMSASLTYNKDGKLYFPKKYEHLFGMDYKEQARDLLAQGIPVLISLKTRGGYKGHWVLIVGCSSMWSESVSAASLYINDPYYSYTTLAEVMADYPIVEKIVAPIAQ